MPGDSAGVAEFAGVLELRATELRDQADVIGRLEPDWQRRGADEFTVLKDTLPPRMGLAADRLEVVAAALHGYADELDSATVDAENAAGDGRLAIQAWTAADTDRTIAVTGAEAEDMSLAEWVEDNPRHPDFETAIDAAEQDLQDAWDDYVNAYTRRTLAADACDAAIITAIDDASPTGTLNDTHPTHLALQDAAELQRLLNELGIEVDSYGALIGAGGVDMGNPNSPYYELYQDLYAHLSRMAGRMEDPGYALSLFDELGADGTYHAFGTIEALQAWAPTDMGWDIENNVLLPFLDGFADATHHLDPATLDEILATAADEDRPERLGQLGLMIGADGSRYDAEFLASATDSILVTQAHRWSQPPSADQTLARPQWDTLHLNTPHLAAYHALAHNIDAAYLFASMGDDNITALLHPSISHAPDSATLQGIGEASADVVTGLLTHDEDPISNGSMGLFVEWVAKHGDVADHIYDPLITGVDHNIAYLDRLINNSLTSQNDNDDYYNVHDFLRMLMGGPDDAPERLFHITSQHNFDRIAGIVNLSDDDRDLLLVEAGALQGLTTRAYINARGGEIWDEHGPDDQTASIVESIALFGLGEIPYLGTAVSAGSTARDIWETANSDSDAFNNLGEEAQILRNVSAWQLNAMVIQAEISAGTDHGNHLLKEASDHSLVDASGNLVPPDDLTTAHSSDGETFDTGRWADYIAWVLPGRDTDRLTAHTTDDRSIQRGLRDGESNAELRHG